MGNSRAHAGRPAVAVIVTLGSQLVSRQDERTNSCRMWCLAVGVLLLGAVSAEVVEYSNCAVSGKAAVAHTVLSA